MTLIQQFGSTLNANIHFHMLFLDGVYVIGEEALAFRRVRPPARGCLEDLVQTIGQRVGAYLERQKRLVRDIENTYRALESTEASTMDDLLGHSTSYRIAIAPISSVKRSRYRRFGTGKRSFKKLVLTCTEGRDMTDKNSSSWIYEYRLTEGTFLTYRDQVATGSCGSLEPLRSNSVKVRVEYKSAP